MAREYLAHSRGSSPREDLLRDHLSRVALRAQDYASAFGAGDEAYLAGLLHDLGKYGDLFQARLRNEVKHIDHWSPGAWACLMHSKVTGVAGALAIQGHHLGLQQAYATALRALSPAELTRAHPQNLRLAAPDHEPLLALLHADGVRLPDPSSSSVYDPERPPAAGMLDIRMLFSALVDADFIETEAHFKATGPDAPAYRTEGPRLDPEVALEALLRHIRTLAEGSRAAADINRLRSDLLEACLRAGEQPQGTFTLTAPTGAGKTLSMLAFALRHAATHGLTRVVMVIPYLSIIEQTVKVFRGALADLVPESPTDTYVLEDHSLAGIRSAEDEDEDPDGDRERRLLAENWDAPIVVTTSVQFLESLFANRPGACRKLHRLAGSVILLDEVQTLPTHLAVPTLATLSHLAGRFGATVVFSTATQPAFDTLHEAVRQLAPEGWRPREIVPPELGLFDRARRVRVQWPKHETVGWDALAGELRGHSQVLCIVNLKRHALELHRHLKTEGAQGLLHLSTNLCPQHRRAVLDEVRARLEQGEPCRLISTQCVEAGVDVDFPHVYRAWGPLDSIAQAAGRCNRNGNRDTGAVHVFVPEDEGYPDQTYGQAAAATRSVMARLGTEPDIDDPALYTEFYRELYDLRALGELRGELWEAIASRHFADVAGKYRLIGTDAINVLVPYDRGVYEALAAEVRQEGLSREWVRRARGHAVSLFRPREQDRAWDYLDRIRVRGNEYADDWYIWVGEKGYDPDVGLILPEAKGLLMA